MVHRARHRRGGPRQTIFKSEYPDATPEQINRLVLELASSGQTTDAPLADLAPGLSAVFRKTGDPRVARNLIQQGQDEAGEADPAGFAQAVADILAISESIGGLDTGQGVGVAAAATGLGIATREAVTGFRNVIFSLMGQGTPDGQEIREREGIDDKDLLLALRQITERVQAGSITGLELELLGGKEAAPTFAALADPDIYAGFAAKVQRVDAAEDYTGRISQNKAKRITGSSKVQSYNLLI